jgi:hypothetical protein
VEVNSLSMLRVSHGIVNLKKIGIYYARQTNLLFYKFF